MIRGQSVFFVHVFLFFFFFLKFWIIYSPSPGHPHPSFVPSPGQIIQNIAMHVSPAARISSFLISVIVVHSVPSFFLFSSSSNSLQRLNDMWHQQWTFLLVSHPDTTFTDDWTVNIQNLSVRFLPAGSAPLYCITVSVKIVLSTERNLWPLRVRW